MLIYGYQIMKYSIKAQSESKNNALMKIKQTEIIFGITQDSIDNYANPAELFLGAFSACILKNVERFSELMNYEYSTAETTVKAERLENPPRMDNIDYKLIIYSQDDNLNIKLLKKNIEKFGTIYNTVKATCSITGNIEKITN